MPYEVCDALRPRFKTRYGIGPFMCVQIHFATGRPEHALSAAKSIAESSPEDVNAHALHLLCMEALGKVDEAPVEAMQACRGMLQCDGLSHRCAAVHQPHHFYHLSMLVAP